MWFATNCHLGQLVGLSHVERWVLGSFVVRIRKVLFIFSFSKFLSLVSFFRVRLSVLGLGLALALALNRL